MRNSWNDEDALRERREEERPRGRNENSSVDPQYEDQAVPEPGWDHERAS